MIEVIGANHYPIDLDGLPHEWSVKFVEDVASEIRSGFASGRHNSDGEGVVHLRPMNVSREGRLVLNEVKHVDPEIDERRVVAGDVVFNNTNSPALIGKTCVVPHGTELAFSNHMTRLRFREDAEPRFVAHQLHYLWMSGYFRHRCVNHVNQASISGKVLGKTVPLVLPPIPEQRSIVSALDSYFSRLDDAVANLERVQRNLKRYRASVLKAAVEGRLVPTEAELARAEGRDYEPASVLLERILAERRRRWEEAELEKMLAKGKPPKNDKWKAKYQEPAEPDLDGLPELPEGWGWATLPQLVTADGHFVDGDWVESKDQDPGGEVRLTQLADVGDGVWRDRSARFLTTRKAVELGCTLLEADDVLIARMPDPLGRACLFPGADRPCVTVVDVCIVRLDREYASPKWLFHALNAPSSRARVKALERGSTRKRISRNNLGTIPIAMPPRAEQASVAAEIERLLTIAERVQRDVAVQVERLASLRQGLLAAAFRGHLLMHNRVLTGTTR